MEEGGVCRRRTVGDIGLIPVMYNTTPHIYMTEMNRNIISILLHENCGWVIP